MMKHQPQLVELKKARRRSWGDLRRGCEDLMCKDPGHTTPKIAASSRTFARNAKLITGADFPEILNWLHQTGK